jgi:hypothetical protein
VRARAAAGSVLEFGGIAHSLGRFCFSFFGKVFAFAFRQAAIRCLAAVSALIPMAQMKPNSSRPSGSTIDEDWWILFLGGLRPHHRRSGDSGEGASTAFQCTYRPQSVRTRNFTFNASG